MFNLIEHQVDDKEYDVSSSIGSPLPDAAVTRPDGSATTLRQVTAGHPAVAFFMRAASCAVCLGHAKKLVAMRAELGADIRAVVVTPGGAKEATRVSRVLGNGAVSVASAPEAAHAGVGLTKGLMLQHSGTVLADGSGVIRYERLATLPTGAFDADELRGAVARLA